MFRLLSKESNIFSVPLYIGFLLLIVISFNFLNFNSLYIFSGIITFAGVALGYFGFNALKLNYQTHLPLFLYTAFIFAFYPGNLDIGIAVSLLTNSVILLLLTSEDTSVRRNSHILTGALLAVNYIFLPTTWPMAIFVIIHIIFTSDRIALHIFRLLLGAFLITVSYFGMAYFLDLRAWNPAYFPFHGFKPMNDFTQLYPLIPVILMLIYAVMDHFKFYNLKSPTSKFKYTFLLLFLLAQLITVFIYMGKNYEYLILLVFPATVILSRMLKFLPKYWMKEAGLWLIIFCLVSFKIGSLFNIF